LGPVWAAAIAMADVVVAAIVMLVGRSFKPGPEIEFDNAQTPPQVKF